MKVNIVSNNSIVRPIPGTKFMTPVYGRDISEAQIIRILNFPALRVYDVKSGAIITKRNINSILNNKDKAVVHADVKKDEPVETKKSKKSHTKEATVEVVEEAPIVDTVEEVIEPDVVVDETIETPVEDIVVNEVETLEETTVNYEEEDVTVTSETTEETPVVEEEVKKPQTQNYNRKKNNRNKH